jgi:hypothetical protein
MHRRAFDTLAEHLKKSVVLAASLGERPLAAPAGTAALGLFDLALERYTDIYRRASFARLPLSHLIDTAIHTEALLAYECAAQARRLAQAKVAAPPILEAQAQRHTERLDELLNGALRGHQLASSSARPYVMPSRGVFVSPETPSLRARIQRERNYFRCWHSGLVTLAEDRDLEELRAQAQQLVILFLDAEELLKEDLRFQSDPGLAPQDIESEFARRLQYAERYSPTGIGEEFSAYYVRLLLKQNVLLRSLHPRLHAEHHHAAHRHFGPLLQENSAQLQAQLVASPEGVAASSGGPTTSLAALQALEQEIQSHAASWSQHGRSADTAGLLFQFEGALGTSLSGPVKALQDAHP